MCTCPPNLTHSFLTICEIIMFTPPKGLYVHGVAKPDLDTITSSHFIFRFFKTFCEHAPRNKLCGSTNFINLGPTDQKLWVFENFRRNLGKAGICWSQPARVDHMCKKRWARGRGFFLAGACLRHLGVAGRRLLVASQP
jgi:hypothetical protein